MAGFLSGAKNLFGGSKKKESGGGGGGVLDMLGGGGDGGMLEILADTATKTDSDGKIAVSDVTGSLVKSGFKENDSGIMDMIKGVISSGGGSSGGESKLSAGGVKSLLSKIPPSLYKDAAMRKVFRQFDKDNSGTVDKAEMGQIMSKLGKTVEGQSDKVVSMVDKDESQTIEYEELIGRINAITG